MQAGEQILQRIVDYIVYPTIVVIYAVGILIFVVGIVQFLWKLKDGKVDQDGKKHMLWGIVGIVIMVSAQAIIYMLLGTFGIDLNESINTSRINGINTGPQFLQR